MFKKFENIRSKVQEKYKDLKDYIEYLGTGNMEEEISSLETLPYFGPKLSPIAKRYQTQICSSVCCPAWNDDLELSMSICENGHNFCNECRKFLSGCSICPALFYPERNSHLFADTAFQLLEDKALECKFISAGCMADFMTKPELILHEQICQYRNFVCNLNMKVFCDNVSIPLENMAVHMERVHSMSGTNQYIAKVNATFSCDSMPEDLTHIRPCKQFMMRCHDRNFIAMRAYNKEKNQAYFWITGDLTEEESEDYIAVICLASPIIEKDESMHILWEGQVVPAAKGFPMDPSDFESGEALTVNGSDYAHLAEEAAQSGIYKLDNLFKIYQRFSKAWFRDFEGKHALYKYEYK